MQIAINGDFKCMKLDSYFKLSMLQFFVLKYFERRSYGLRVKVD